MLRTWFYFPADALNANLVLFFYPSCLSFPGMSWRTQSSGTNSQPNNAEQENEAHISFKVEPCKSEPSWADNHRRRHFIQLKPAQCFHKRNKIRTSWKTQKTSEPAQSRERWGALSYQDLGRHPRGSLKISGNVDCPTCVRGKRLESRMMRRGICHWLKRRDWPHDHTKAIQPAKIHSGQHVNSLMVTATHGNLEAPPATTTQFRINTHASQILFFLRQRYYSFHKLVSWHSKGVEGGAACYICCRGVSWQMHPPSWFHSDEQKHTHTHPNTQRRRGNTTWISNTILNKRVWGLGVLKLSDSDYLRLVL